MQIRKDLDKAELDQKSTMREIRNRCVDLELEGRKALEDVERVTLLGKKEVMIYD